MGEPEGVSPLLLSCRVRREWVLAVLLERALSGYGCLWSWVESECGWWVAMGVERTYSLSLTPGRGLSDPNSVFDRINDRPTVTSKSGSISRFSDFETSPWRPSMTSTASADRMRGISITVFRSGSVFSRVNRPAPHLHPPS